MGMAAAAFNSVQVQANLTTVHTRVFTRSMDTIHTG